MIRHSLDFALGSFHGNLWLGRLAILKARHETHSPHDTHL